MSGNRVTQIRHEITGELKKMKRTRERKKKGLENVLDYINHGSNDGKQEEPEVEHQSTVIGEKRKTASETIADKKKRKLMEMEKQRQERNERTLNSINSQAVTAPTNVDIYDMDHLETHQDYTIRSNKFTNSEFGMDYGKKPKKDSNGKYIGTFRTNLRNTHCYEKFIEEQTKVEQMQRNRAVSLSQGSSVENLSQEDKNEEQNYRYMDQLKKWDAKIYYVPPPHKFMEYVDHMSEYWKKMLSDEEIEKMKSGPCKDFHFCSVNHVKIMLRERYSIFRECAFGESCIVKDKWNGFCSMEYLSPEEYEHVLEHGEHKNVNRECCYLCLLYLANLKYAGNQTLQSNTTELANRFFHKHGIGEYDKSAMIPGITTVRDEAVGIPSAVCEAGSGCGESSGYENSAENTYGLTYNLRPFLVSDYSINRSESVYVTPAMCKNKNGKTIQVRVLTENPEVFFSGQHGTRNCLRKINPYTFVYKELLEKYGTLEALLNVFKQGTQDGMGFLRLRFQSGRTSKKPNTKIKEDVDTTKYMRFTIYIGHDLDSRFDEKSKPNGFKAFPFQTLFTKDITKTADNLEEMLEAGRINFDELFVKNRETGKRSIMLVNNYYVDLTKPLEWYSNQLNSDNYCKYRYFMAVVVRMFVLRNITVNYPNSDNSKHDGRVRTLFKIFLDWNKPFEELFGIKLAEDGTYQLPDRIIEDSEVMKPEFKNKIAELVSRDIEKYEYAEDRSFLKYRTEVRVRLTPVQEILKYLQTQQMPPNYNSMTNFQIISEVFKNINDCANWLFCDFEEGRRYLKHQMSDYRLKELWETKGSYFLCGAEEPLSKLPLSMWRGEYSILILLLLRVNHAYKQQEAIIIGKRSYYKSIMDSRNDECMKLYEKYNNVDKTYSDQENDENKDNMEDVTTRKRINREKRNTDALKQRIYQELMEKRKHYKQAKKMFLEQRRICYVYRLFIYTHLHLAQFITSLRLVTDRDLESPVEREKLKYLPFRNYYQEAYPHPTKSPCEGMLPLLGVIMMAATFIDNKPSEAFDSVFASQSFFRDLRKMMPRVCQARTNYKSLLEVCHDSKSFLHLVIQSLELSLLGCYEHALEQPSFKSAISIYEWLGTSLDEDSFKKWQEEHGKTLVCVMREMFCFQYETYSPYEAHIIHMYDGYPKFKDKVRKSADVIRSYLSQDATMTECEKVMERLWPTSSKQNENTEEEEEINNIDLDNELDQVLECMDENSDTDSDSDDSSSSSSESEFDYDIDEMGSENTELSDGDPGTAVSVESNFTNDGSDRGKTTIWEKSMAWTKVKKEDFLFQACAYDRIQQYEKKGISELNNKELELYRISKLELEAEELKYNVYHNVSEDPLRALCKHMKAVNMAGFRLRQRYKLPRQLRDFIIRRVTCIYPGSPLDLNILYEFNFGMSAKSINANVSEKTVKILLTVMYMIANRSRKEFIWKMLDTINRKDWEIVEVYFNALMQHYSIKILRLGADAYERNCKVLCKRYNVDNIKDISPYSYSLLLSMCCNTCVTYVAQMKSVKYHGHKGMFVSTLDSNNTPYCKKTSEKKDKLIKSRKVRALYTKLEEALLDEDAEVEAEIVEKLLGEKMTLNRKRLYINQPRCGTFPLTPVPLLGCVVQITEMSGSSNSSSSTSSSLPVTRAYALCNLCGAVSRFSVRMIGPNGFNCTRCKSHNNQNEARDFYLPECVSCRRLVTPPQFMISPSFVAIDNRKDIGDFKSKLCMVCTHCNNRKASKFDQEMYTAADIRACMKYNTHMKRKVMIMENSIQFKYDEYGGAYMHDITGEGTKTRRRRSNTVIHF